MKNIIFRLAAVCFLVLFSCSKDDAIVEEQQVESIETQIEKVHEVFLQVKESNPNAVLWFSMDGNELTSKIEVSNENTYNLARSSEEPLCKGDGYKFAKCVKKVLDDLGCVVIKTCTYCAYGC